VISPTPRPLPENTKHTRDKNPCPRQDSNLQSQQARDGRHMPYTARPPASVSLENTGTEICSLRIIQKHVLLTAVHLGDSGHEFMCILSYHHVCFNEETELKFMTIYCFTGSYCIPQIYTTRKFLNSVILSVSSTLYRNGNKKEVKITRTRQARYV